MSELLSQNWRIHYSIWLLKRSSWSHLATGGISWSLLSLEDAPEELLGGRLLWRWQRRLAVAPAGGLLEGILLVKFDGFGIRF